MKLTTEDKVLIFTDALGIKVKCLNCSRIIETKKDKFVSVTTHNNNGKEEIACFHFDCWIEYFNKRVENKSRADVEKMQTMAVGLLKNPVISGLLRQVNPSGQVEVMLKTPLTDKAKVKAKLENGKRKRKSKM